MADPSEGPDVVTITASSSFHPPRYDSPIFAPVEPLVGNVFM